MRERNAYLYLKSFDLAGVDALAHEMQQVGFGLLNPETQQITAIRDVHDVENEEKDIVGDYMPVPRDWLAARLGRRIKTSLLWLRDDWTSLFFHVDFRPAGVELLWELNSVVGESYEQAMLDTLLARFKNAVAADNALGLVMDPDAFTEEFEWSNFFFDTAPFKDVLPRVLALPAHKLGQLATRTDQARQETLKEFTIFYSE